MGYVGLRSSSKGSMKMATVTGACVIPLACKRPQRAQTWRTMHSFRWSLLRPTIRAETLRRKTCNEASREPRLSSCTPVPRSSALWGSCSTSTGIMPWSSTRWDWAHMPLGASARHRNNHGSRLAFCWPTQGHETPHFLDQLCFSATLPSQRALRCVTALASRLVSLAWPLCGRNRQHNSKVPRKRLGKAVPICNIEPMPISPKCPRQKSQHSACRAHAEQMSRHILRLVLPTPWGIDSSLEGKQALEHESLGTWVCPVWAQQMKQLRQVLSQSHVLPHLRLGPM